MTRLVHLSFVVFLKLNALSAIGFGIVLGLLNPLGALLGFEIVAGVEAPWLTGVRAWLAYLVVIPAVFALLSLVFSVVSYLPTRLLLRVAGGVALDGPPPSDPHDT
jgi:hypothetical protein